MAKETKIKKAFVYEDSEHLSAALKGLNTLRKNKHFCDVVLQIGSHEIHAHRPVLACASPYLFDLFSATSSVANIGNRFKLDGDFDKDSFERLVNYAYTARLEVPHDQVKAVYMSAIRLRMDNVAKRCGQFLVNHLSPQSCIGIRSVQGLYYDYELCTTVDNYIQQEIKEVSQSKELHALPVVKIEVLRNSQGEMDVIQGQQLCSMVLDWIRQEWECDGSRLITEKVHMLYIDSDLSLRDCTDIEIGDVNDSELVQDYKHKCKLFPKPSGKSKKARDPVDVPAKPRQLLYSRSTSDSSISSEGSEDNPWKVIAYMSTGDYRIMGIVVLNNRLFVLSVKQKLNQPSKGSPTPPTPTILKHAESYSLLSPMNSARCSVGTAELDGQLLVCGGYDRGECLKTVQLYDPKNNTWSVLQSMKHSRGRFDITVVDSKVYAVGGCDGVKELDSVECYDATNKKWIMSPRLLFPRSNAGVCTLNGRIYCVGGWNGHVGTKRCDVLDPGASNWVEMAPLLTGRSQAAVCVADGSVYAIGGCDSWNCLNTVEKYDPETKVWSRVASMNTARRGCGAAEYMGKIYVVGGSDGARSLCSIEIYDPATNTWTQGPNLTSCRANVGVAVVDGRLYAVGGFNGKTFLNTIECWDSAVNEWTTFTVHDHNGHFQVNGHEVNEHNQVNGHVEANGRGDVNSLVEANGHGEVNSLVEANGHGEVNGHNEVNGLSSIYKGMHGIHSNGDVNGSHENGEVNGKHNGEIDHVLTNGNAIEA